VSSASVAGRQPQEWPSRPGSRDTVLVVPSSSTASGLVSYLSHMIRAFPDLPVTILTIPGSDLHRALPEGVPMVPTTGSRSDMAHRLAAWTRRCTGVQTHGPRALLAARTGGIRRGQLMHVFHEIPYVGGRQGWLELLLAVGTGRAANGVPMGDWLRNVGLPPQWILPPVLGAPRTLAPDAARRFLRVGGDRLILGVVGRLSAVKAPLLAVDAVTHLDQALRKRVTLCFLGTGPLAQSIAARAARMSIEVRLCGHVPEAASLLAGFNAVIAPSARETFGIALAEAAIAGIPVAAVDSPGSRLISDSGRLLQLARPAPEALAAAIEGAIASGASSELASHLMDTYGARTLGPVYRAHYRRLAELAT
jgi:glycosyltransferase involved in cell wall biosynthesis